MATWQSEGLQADSEVMGNQASNGFCSLNLEDMLGTEFTT